MMAVVTLNRLVFEQAVAQVLDRVQSAVRDFETATEKVQVRAGGVLAQEVRECSAALREEIVKVIERVDLSVSTGPALNNSASLVARTAWLVAGLSLALILFAIGVWLGARLR
jgi:CHASE3 domain sensor protein